MKLAEWRKHARLTQAEMAALVGVANRETIARYEAGRMPRRDVLIKIMRLTHGLVTPNDFVEK